MYQGKFAAKDKKGNVPQRVQQAPKAEKPAAPQQRPAPQRPQPNGNMARPQINQGRPAAAVRPAAPQPQNVRGPVPPQVQPPVQKKRHYGSLVFYIIFFACILAIYTFTYVKLGDLQNWLVRYEAAQPTRKYEEVFDLYFKDPNWGLLYDNAGIPESTYEGREAFIAYMEQKVGDTPLTGLETSAGLSKDKKFIIRLGDEKVASFTLTCN